MPKVITFDKGSKRRLKQIRWKLVEMFSVALLAVFAFVVSLLVVVWELRHIHPHSEPTKGPLIKNAEPTDREY